MFWIADSNKSALLGGFRWNSSLTAVSTPAFLRKTALWIAVNPSSITFSRGAGGGCNPQYRFLGTWKYTIHWVVLRQFKNKKNILKNREGAIRDTHNETTCKYACAERREIGGEKRSIYFIYQMYIPPSACSINNKYRSYSIFVLCFTLFLLSRQII